MRRLSKQGQLLKHVSSIVIVVIGVLILFAGGLAAYAKIRENSELTNAKNALDALEKHITLLGVGENTTLTLQGPSGWSLFVWDASVSPRPDKCYFKSCVCACKTPSIIAGGFDKEAIKNCQSSTSAVCRLLDDDHLLTEIVYRNKLDVSFRVAKLDFPANLMDLRIRKKPDGLHLQEYSPYSYDDNDYGALQQLPP